MWETGLGAFLVLLYVTSPFLAVFLILVALSFRRARAARETPKTKRAVALEIGWVLTVAIIWAVINVVSLAWIPEGIGIPPYLYQSTEEQTLEVTAFMWGWNFSTTTLKANVPVRIIATSVDTVHGLGIYGPDGKLIATVMLMPSMTEQIVLTFEPGVYTVRCLEYCGDGHAFMTAVFRVV